jgi:hypothetical protein
VIQGQALVHKIELLDTDTEDHPWKKVTITESGELPMNLPFVISDQAYE